MRRYRQHYSTLLLFGAACFLVWTHHAQKRQTAQPLSASSVSAQGDPAQQPTSTAVAPQSVKRHVVHDQHKTLDSKVWFRFFDKSHQNAAKDYPQRPNKKLPCGSKVTDCRATPHVFYFRKCKFLYFVVLKSGSRTVRCGCSQRFAA